MWIYNKDSEGYFEVEDEKIINRLRNDDRFEIDVKVEIQTQDKVEDVNIDVNNNEDVVSNESEVLTEINVENNSIEDKDNYCSICDKEFKNNVGLQAHNRAKHGGDE